MHMIIIYELSNSVENYFHIKQLFIEIYVINILVFSLKSHTIRHTSDMVRHKRKDK